MIDDCLSHTESTWFSMDPKITEGTIFVNRWIYAGPDCTTVENGGGRTPPILEHD
jgi:hypothetical protein